ncbi:hypothetical protein NLG97_g356 [Lecanicillium saksenae]|uniref:Uncharacterized protein n=1 Tax=Lecanicillium saksenae TaxID=468837 RepID=A0ACC1R9H0_9HYPO|nr:hypothetical protein NLG97_g356 [Lecanicillium saksenae]
MSTLMQRTPDLTAPPTMLAKRFWLGVICHPTRTGQTAFLLGQSFFTSSRRPFLRLPPEAGRVHANSSSANGFPFFYLRATICVPRAEPQTTEYIRYYTRQSSCQEDQIDIYSTRNLELPASILGQPIKVVRATPTSLSRFARRGGPDLRHLRGYSELKHAVRMSSNRSSTPSDRRTLSTKATTVSSRAKRSSAYDKDFEQNLIDHGIYPEGFEHTDGRSTPEPKNLDDIVKDLAHPRASLSPSQFSVSAFKSFKAANSRVISEGKVMADILPTIRGNSEIPNEGNLPFANLDSITNGTTVDAVPEWYDGSRAKEISKNVRQDLNKIIMPTSRARAPVLPNFFIEAKAPRGGADVAKRQACLDGAIGARALHSLQSYGEDVPTYDGNAHAFSSTYHAGTGTLQLYAHHVTGPTGMEERPEYHMTQLKAYALTSDKGAFVQGATAFRNARDMARRQRESFIRSANARASLTEAADSDSTAWQYSHDDLQQQIANNYAEDSDGNGEAPTTLQRRYRDESLELGQDSLALESDDLSMSFASNVTSNLSTDTTRPKRSRQSFSSPTHGSRSSKSRSRLTTTRPPVVSPAACTGPEPSELGQLQNEAKGKGKR